MESAIGSKENNLEKLMVVMKPTESCVEDESCITSFDVECLTSIAVSPSILSSVNDLQAMGVQYTEQKKQFIALRLNLLRQLMEHYLCFNSRDDFMGSKYREFMIK
jgi:hypothetical protein